MFSNKGTLPFALTLLTVGTSLAETPALILTPLIKQNKLEQARNASTVNPKDFLNITSFSAFLTVDDRYNSNLFFWYFPVAKEVDKTPWIIWLQGGPGATSLAGLFAEMGPFKYDTVSEELKILAVNEDSGTYYIKFLVLILERQFSWCDEYSMVFIDNPVGAGFSFTDSDEGFVRNMEMYADTLYSAIKQLVQVYPELSRAPLYIAGESYAGRYVPALATKILEGRDQNKNSINLQGLIMGNPVTDRSSIVDYTRVFYNWGLVDAQGAVAAKPLQEQYQQAINDGDNTAAHKIREDLLDKLQDIAFKSQLNNVLQETEGLEGLIPFITRSTVKEALHVGGIPFTFSNRTVHTKLIPDFLSHVSPKIDVLLESYRILIYCGQLDLVTPCVLSAEARRKNLQWSRRDDFLNAPRLPWWFNNTVAGYVKSGGNLIEIQVNGAGHIVAADKPAQAKQIVDNFIKGQEFPPPPGYKVAGTNPKYQEYTDLRVPEVSADSSGIRNGLIASIILNVLLLIGIVVGGVMSMRWKRENDYFNLPLSDDILTFA